MLPRYGISELIAAHQAENPFFLGTFEDTEEAPDIQWPHRHEFYSLVWFTSGQGTNVIDFIEYDIQPDRLFFMHPKQVHNWSYTAGTTGFVLVFDKHFIKHIPAPLQDCVFLDVKSSEREFTKMLFLQLIKDSRHGPMELIYKGIEYVLIHSTNMLDNTKTSPRKIDKSASKFLILIDRTITQSITVTEYAGMLEVSDDYLSVICKESFGQKPKAIILDKKITEAKRLLYYSDLSITEIAFRLGFEDSSYFSRIFKQKTGSTPSLFKKVPD